jgi:hydroxyacylglutathione hydrolase
VTAPGLQIVAVPAFADNYLWLVHDEASGETAVVDPGDAAPVLAAAESRGWRIGQVWNTHWHPDHTGGNQAVIAATGATLSAPAAEAARIPAIDVALKDGDTVRIGNHVGEVWAVPGHTLGHIAFVFRDAGVAFVGDTMFAMGCGRLFEGTPSQMFGSFERLGHLPDDTQLYCAHEYTLANARFAAAVEPGNADIAQRLAAVEAMRARGEATIPTTIAAERATNPFLRALDVAEFAALRAKKDRF